MIPRSRAASPTGSPRACSRTSTATAARSTRPRPRADARLVLALAALCLTPACAYLNTFYNAQQAYDEGLRLSNGSDSLPQAAREAFQSAAEKSAIVLERYPDSEYVDDALYLMGESFYRMGSWTDAAASFERYVSRFPEGDRVAAARLGWARSERRQGDTAAAEAALAPLLDSAGGDVDSDVVYEHALILLAIGQRERAAESYERLLAEHPEFATDRELNLEFAEAQLAAGEYASALAAYRALAAAVEDPQRRREIEIRAARALALAGRADEALDAYAEVLTATVVDSLAAEVQVERGHILEQQGDWEAAVDAYLQAAQLAPGSAAASRATLHRGRIAWKLQGRREEALDILLDAFIHSPTSASGDSARTESRELARLLHFQRIVDGEVPVPQIQDPGLARSTAMYRLAEEVLEAEGDREAAAEMFWQLGERFPESPWRPRAMLASGKLLAEAGTAIREGTERLTALVEEYPDHPAADSARRILGLEVPVRAGDFYAPDADLAVLASVLPAVSDPMLEIGDQMNRYQTAASQRTVSRDTRQAAPGEPPDPVVEAPQEPDDAPPQPTTTPSGRVIEP